MAARSHLVRQEWNVRQSTFQRAVTALCAATFDDKEDDKEDDDDDVNDNDNAPRRYRLIRKAVSGSNDGKHGAVCEGDGAVPDDGSDCGCAMMRPRSCGGRPSAKLKKEQ